MGSDKRERQRAARQAKIEELRVQEQRSQTRRRSLIIGGVVSVFVIGVILFTVVTGGGDDDDAVATDDTSATDDTGATDDTSATDGTGYPGVIEGTTPCPADDAPRTIDFTDAFQSCLEPGVDYQAVFTTTAGTVTVDLLEEEQANTVNNFVALTRYGYYDDTLLFRTDPSIDIIQGGSPHTQDNRDPGPGYTIPDTGGEFGTDPETGAYTGPFTYEPGQLIMARSAGPDSSGAQFFFSTGPNVSLLDSQGTYLLFGEVTEGLDVLEAIIASHVDDPSSGLGGGPDPEVTVERVEIVEA